MAVSAGPPHPWREAFEKLAATGRSMVPVAVSAGPPHPWREAFEKLAAIDFTPPPPAESRPELVGAGTNTSLPHVDYRPTQPAQPCAAPESSSPVERARDALADRLRRFNKAGKRPSRQQAYKWCIQNGHQVPFIRFKISVWPDACSLAKVPEWTRSGRIPDQQSVTESEIDEP